MRPLVAVVATLDTKQLEASFVQAELCRRGCDVRLIDVGLRSVSGGDVSSEETASAAGHDLTALREGSSRALAMEAMGRGAGKILVGWQGSGQLHGVLGIGGNQGTAVASEAMRALPYGVPKLIVSTVASGNVRGFVGDADITLMFSVGDLLGGPNFVTRGVLVRAATALAGMARAALEDPSGAPNRAVAVTAFGNTHGAVVAAMADLVEAGLAPVPFHASGASGSAMERLADEGRFEAVLDLTTHELLAELYPADIYTPVRPGRLTAAGRRGIPQVVAPGGLEYHCFGAPGTIPSGLLDRPVHHHNPNNTNVRATAEELAVVGRVMAERLNAATGPAAVLIPSRGWSEIGSPGGALHDPQANAAFVTELRRALSPRVILDELDVTINDPLFAAAAVRALLSFLSAESSFQAGSPGEPECHKAIGRVEGGRHEPANHADPRPPDHADRSSDHARGGALRTR